LPRKRKLVKQAGTWVVMKLPIIPGVRRQRTYRLNHARRTTRSNRPMEHIEINEEDVVTDG